ncbi:hypothetical protein LXA43DRAFT_1091127 [Ganoderma leucocontextum]|nr:hypothetical protein LXA43DRAFT_1091127 [Ganoderma leucocontextum]
MPNVPDLPDPPVDGQLDHFVRELHSPSYTYDISCVPNIISDFLVQVRSIPVILGCIDLDDYFRGTYRFLMEQPEAQRPAPDVLRTFWEDYSHTSRQRCIEHNCEELRLAEEAHREAYDRYRAVLLSCIHGDISADDPRYEQALAAQEETSATVREFEHSCDDTARSLAVVRTWGVYWGPEWGTSPLVGEN